MTQNVVCVRLACVLQRWRWTYRKYSSNQAVYDNETSIHTQGEPEKFLISGILGGHAANWSILAWAEWTHHSEAWTKEHGVMIRV